MLRAEFFMIALNGHGGGYLSAREGKRLILAIDRT